MNADRDFYGGRSVPLRFVDKLRCEDERCEQDGLEWFEDRISPAVLSGCHAETMPAAKFFNGKALVCHQRLSHAEDDLTIR